MLAITPVMAQNVKVVDNTGTGPSGESIYASLQLAIDDANPGDIIQILPSPHSYGSANIHGVDGLTLIGLGFNAGADSRVSSYDTILENLDIRNSSNIQIRGLQIRGSLGITIGIVATSDSENILIKESVISKLDIDRVQRLMVSHSYIYEALSTAESYSMDLEFSNCIINPTALNLIYNVSFNHNLFYGSLISGAVRNSMFKNNLFVNLSYSNDNVSWADKNLSFYNNFSTIDLDVEEGSNNGEANIFSNELIQQIFTDRDIDNDITEWDLGWDFISNNANVLDSADDGTNVGPTGGIKPLQKSMYSLPMIHSISMPSVARYGGEIEVKLKFKEQ